MATLAARISAFGGVIRGVDRVILNVNDYGAASDGVTDDTAAVQMAVDAVPSNGGEIFFPGICLVNKQINITRPSVRMRSIGWDQANLAAGGGLKAGAPMASVVNVTDTATTFKFSEMQIDGNGKATNCLTIDSLNCQIREAHFRRPADNGTHINITPGGVSVWVLNCRMNGANQPGTTGMVINATDAIITGNKPVNVVHGIVVKNGGNGAQINGNHMTPGGKIGVNCIWLAETVSNIGIADNRIDNHALGSGIQLSPSTNCFSVSIVGNVFFQNIIAHDKFAAIGIDTSRAKCSGMVILGNVVRGTATSRYASLVSAQTQDGTPATNPDRLSSSGLACNSNTAIAATLFGHGTPMTYAGNTFSPDGASWSTPVVAENLLAD